MQLFLLEGQFIFDWKDLIIIIMRSAGCHMLCLSSKVYPVLFAI